MRATTPAERMAVAATFEVLSEEKLMTHNITIHNRDRGT